MTGETLKTTGIALSIRPWSRTSHIVSWLTPDVGVLPILVKGAVRPKSAYLGQYDLFYTCGIVYYARPHGGLWLPREIWPLERRDSLRGRWRETSLAAYAADVAAELAPPDRTAAAWFDSMTAFLDSLAAPGAPMSPRESLAALARFELDALDLAGLAPDLRHVKPSDRWTEVAVDGGHPARGRRVVRLPRDAAAVLAGRAAAAPPAALRDALRFLGAFLAYHLERKPAARRVLVSLLDADTAEF